MKPSLLCALGLSTLLLFNLPESCTATTPVKHNKPKKKKNKLPSATDGKLKQPETLVSNGRNLELNLSLEKGDHNTVAATTFQTRLLGGSLPGPTVRVKSGEWLYLNFQNDLEEQPGTNTNENEFAFPDSSNLYFHGPHISGERPGDDATIIVDPGESFRYEVFFPKFHVGGTYWIHPHRHGSGTIQVGGGAASVLIVEDEPGDVPPEVESAEEVILMVQLFDTDTFDYKLRPQSLDQLFILETAPGVAEDFRLVNGMYRPTLDAVAGEWQRWRVVFGAWNRDSLDLQMPTGAENCEMNLLAKDGIYIDDYPRPLDFYPIPTGGRADIMVRCDVPGSYVVNDYGGELFTVNVAPARGRRLDVTPPTEGFKFAKPNYLTDLLSTRPTTGCSCDTYMDSDQINGLSYDPDIFLHMIGLGNVVERTVTGISSHPYHQHVYPFQLQEFFGTLDAKEAAYFQIGDYHDSMTILGSDTTKIKYVAGNYPGRVTVQCHKITHSDVGMRSAEFVQDGLSCNCSPKFEGGGFTRPPTSEPTGAPVLEATQQPVSSSTKSTKSSKKSKASKSTKKQVY